MENFELEVSAPGRLCLFCEHQDYFGLPIISAAINLRILISGKKRSDKKFKIKKPDLGEEDEFWLEKELSYLQERDYLRSSINTLQREGIHFSSGWDCLIRGTIPINSGSAGSSALVVAWIKFLLEAQREYKHLAPEKIAEWGFLAEVAEFKEPGGKMDHYSSSLGGVLSIHFDENLRFKKLKNPLKEFVLADSLQKKDTTGMLGHIKSHVLRGVASVNKNRRDFNLKTLLTPEVQHEIEKLPPEEK